MWVVQNISPTYCIPLRISFISSCSYFSKKNSAVTFGFCCSKLSRSLSSMLSRNSQNKKIYIRVLKNKDTKLGLERYFLFDISKCDTWMSLEGLLEMVNSMWDRKKFDRS